MPAPVRLVLGLALLALPARGLWRWVRAPSGEKARSLGRTLGSFRAGSARSTGVQVQATLALFGLALVASALL